MDDRLGVQTPIVICHLNVSSPDGRDETDIKVRSRCKKQWEEVLKISRYPDVYSGSHVEKCVDSEPRIKADNYYYVQ